MAGRIESHSVTYAVLLFVVETQLGALRAFHVFLRVLTLQQERGVADAVVELGGIAHGLAFFRPLALVQLARTVLS
jgi:hypothetical protein